MQDWKRTWLREKKRTCEREWVIHWLWELTYAVRATNFIYKHDLLFKYILCLSNIVWFCRSTERKKERKKERKNYFKSSNQCVAVFSQKSVLFLHNRLVCLSYDLSGVAAGASEKQKLLQILRFFRVSHNWNILHPKNTNLWRRRVFVDSLR